MFTGLITDIGTISASEARGDLRLRIACGYDMESIALGASIACSGACLTVIAKGPDWFEVDLSAETVARTAPGRWTPGTRLNLERALKVGDELGGHIVTGHVDGLAMLESVAPVGDSHQLMFVVPKPLAPYVAPKGSISIDGVSLTVNEVVDRADGSAAFALNIIPHTWAQTTLGDLAPGDAAHVEIDVLARYLSRMESLRHA